jgi:uncharacterized protein YecT (DUF1311 family)
VGHWAEGTLAGEMGEFMSQPTVIRREKRVRGTFGQIIKWAFIGFNVLMLLWLVSGMVAVGNVYSGATSGAAQAGAAIGSAIGFGMILSIWALGDIILGLFVLLTRGELVVIEEQVSPQNGTQSQLRTTVEDTEKKKSPVLIAALCAVGVVILLAVIGSLSHSGAPTSETATTDQSSPPEEVVTTKVSSQTLAAAYSANEVAAQKRYGNQTLDVTGVVEGIALDFTDSPVVRLNGVNPFLSVQASFDKSASDQLSALSKGQVVTVRCTSITEVISAPMLSGCTLPPPPAPPAPVSSQDSNQVAASAQPAPSEEPATSNVPESVAPADQTALAAPPIPVTVKPSFDCASASNAAERTVCSNNQLAALDIQIASLYRAAREAAADPSVIRADQRQWIDERNQCGSVQCLANIYNRRKTELAEWVGPNP